jgi:alpha-glucosidase
MMTQRAITKTIFSQQPQRLDASGEIVSPWRVTILAADLNVLANSDIVKNLCPPPAPELINVSWIRPGRSTWGWLSCYCAPKLDDQKAWIGPDQGAGI